MPLYKRKPFLLSEAPKDLNPNEQVFQVRFTKEIFKDYQEYLNKLNLYRQRLWTCKVTGKTNMTYEEALVSERRAMEKVQEFPKELAGPILRMIQYSTLWLYDLVDEIYAKLQEKVLEGMELQAKKDDSLCACKILKVLEEGQYEIGWLDKARKVVDTSIVNAEDIVRKKSAVSRSMLKAFIRESTSRGTPWVVHNALANEHGISTELPARLKDWLNDDGSLANNIKKRRRITENETYEVSKKARKDGETVRYPIDDYLVKPGHGDPDILNRPSPCTDFQVPMDCVGDLLMVWNFCSTFGRLLNLWPFSLEDFENAICHKDSSLVLIAETHSAMLRLLMKEEGDYCLLVQNKKRKQKITRVNWTEYLCNFLEMGIKPELAKHLGTIKRGHYGLLEIHIKLSVFLELISEVLMTSAFRNKLNNFVEQQQALRASKREQDKRKKEQNEVSETNCTENGEENLHHEESAEQPSSFKVHRRGKVKDKEIQGNLERQIEKFSIRANPLGKDRDYTRYWFFRREERLFIESSDSRRWAFYTSKEELDALLASLNTKGERERALKKQLEKHYDRISNALQKKSKGDSKKILIEEAVLRRSTRVRAQPRDGEGASFLRYVNKWKNDS